MESRSGGVMTQRWEPTWLRWHCVALQISSCHLSDGLHLRQEHVSCLVPYNGGEYIQKKLFTIRAFQLRRLSAKTKIYLWGFFLFVCLVVSCTFCEMKLKLIALNPTVVFISSVLSLYIYIFVNQAMCSTQKPPCSHFYFYPKVQHCSSVYTNESSGLCWLGLRKMLHFSITGVFLTRRQTFW